MNDNAAAAAEPERPVRQESNLRNPDMQHISSGCEQLTKTVVAPGGDLTIISDITLSAAKGETVAITGASGSGKTTLLGLLAGLDRPSSGSVWLAGERIDGLSEDARAALRRDRVGFVFQSFHLLPTLTALENVLLPMEVAGTGDARDRAEAALDAVGLGKRLRHYPRQLSGGEQQRVAIARAFAPGPEVLFADEPTGNLDGATGRAVSDLLFDLNSDRGTTMVMVTHDLGLARQCQTRFALSDGSLAEPEQ